jgi:hypothetical protein
LLRFYFSFSTYPNHRIHRSIINILHLNTRLAPPTKAGLFQSRLLFKAFLKEDVWGLEGGAVLKLPSIHTINLFKFCLFSHCSLSGCFDFMILLMPT